MAQDNTARKDTSMDDILSSIRRIIDESEARKAEHADGPSAPANDVVPSPSHPVSSGFPVHPFADHDDPSSLQNVLAKLDAEMSESKQEEPAPTPKSDPVVAKRDEKYEARFSEEDSRAFATLGDVLAEQAATPVTASMVAPIIEQVAAVQSDSTPEPPSAKSAPEQAVAVLTPTVEHLEKLVSEPVAQAVAHSFGNLEDVLSRHSGQSLTEVTQTMLKPMLQDWLDENLPSMVERMVRGEIERIARGEPRQG